MKNIYHTIVLIKFEQEFLKKVILKIKKYKIFNSINEEYLNRNKLKN